MFVSVYQIERLFLLVFVGWPYSVSVLWDPVVQLLSSLKLALYKYPLWGLFDLSCCNWVLIDVFLFWVEACLRLAGCEAQPQACCSGCCAGANRTKQNRKQYKNIQKTPTTTKTPQKIIKVKNKYEKKGKGRIENMKIKGKKKRIKNRKREMVYKRGRGKWLKWKKEKEAERN